MKPEFVLLKTDDGEYLGLPTCEIEKFVINSKNKSISIKRKSSSASMYVNTDEEDFKQNARTLLKLTAENENVNFDSLLIPPPSKPKKKTR